jgi:hypothetical protein
MKLRTAAVRGTIIAAQRLMAALPDVAIPSTTPPRHERHAEET